MFCGLCSSRGEHGVLSVALLIAWCGAVSLVAFVCRFSSEPRPAEIAAEKAAKKRAAAEAAAKAKAEQEREEREKKDKKHHGKKHHGRKHK